MPFFNQTKHFILSQTPEITGRFTQTSKQLKKTTKLFSTIEEINKQLPKKGGATLIVDFTIADGDLFEQFLNFFNQNEEKIQTCIFLLSDEHAEKAQSFFDKVLNSGSFDLVFNADQLNINDFEKLIEQSATMQQEEAEVKVQFPLYYKIKESTEHKEEKGSVMEKENVDEANVNMKEKNLTPARPPHEYEAIIQEKDQEIQSLKVYSEQQEKYMDDAEAQIKELNQKLLEQETNKSEEAYEQLKKERDKLLKEVASVKQQLSENSVYQETVKDLKEQIKTLKQEKNSYKQRAEKAEAMHNMDSPEASVVELVNVMRNLSDTLNKNSKKLENEAGREVKQLQKQVSQLTSEKEATEQIKNNLRQLLGN